MSRAIDKLPTPPYIREKKVIIIARSRTGTLSIYKAMNILGYKTYHGAEIMRNGVPHMAIAEEALAAKALGKGKPYGKAELDKWLWDYDCIVELPAIWPDEFYHAYPDATFIHVERDPDKWYKSIMNTLGHSLSDCDSFPLKQLRWIDDYVDKFCSFHLMVHQAWWHGLPLDQGEAVLKQDYIDMNNHVKKMIPPEKLHSFKLEDGFGWEQLCGALGVPIPEVPYPQANTPVQFDKMQVGFVKKAMRKAVVLGATSVLVPAIGVAAWYYRKFQFRL
nr:SonE [Paraconiothyrium archidendri]